VDATKAVVTGVTETVGEVDIDWHGRPSCVTLSDGTVAMVYVDGDVHAATVGGVHIRFSDDYGATWTDKDKTLGDDAVSFPTTIGEPFLFAAPNGNLICAGADVWSVAARGTYQSISTDGGATWSEPAAMAITGIDGDTDFLALIDDSFIYDGVIYLSGRISTDQAEANVKSVLVKSIDNGVNWTWVSDITAAGQSHEVGIEYLGSNRIIALIRDNGNSQTYRCFSNDMGATWTTPEDINYMVRKTGKHRIFTLAHLKGEANWWEDTHLLTGCFEFTASSTRTNCLLFSSDSGQTWSPPRWVDSAYEDAGYGHIFWNPTTEQVVFMNYAGTAAAAALKQYNVTVDWKEV
jgi:hypothetical protein